MSINYYVCLNCGEASDEYTDFIHCSCDAIYCSDDCVSSAGCREMDEQDLQDGIIDDPDDIGVVTCSFCRHDNLTDEQLVEAFCRMEKITRHDLVQKVLKWSKKEG